MMRERPTILFVDDEPRVLEGLALTLRRRFDVTTAASGVEALAIMNERPSFAAVVSDMRMPIMDGATFLARARESWPDTVRLLLTGESDLESAIHAVNEGQIFRFLTKPCPPELLIKSLEGAVEQHRLVTAERELLEETLRGSIRALVDLLALTSPLAFGRALRVKRLVERLAAALGLADVWALDVAALLSQIGFVALPPSIVEKIVAGRPLALHEQEMADKTPGLALHLLDAIPRLEPVREILASHVRPFVEGTPAHVGHSGEHLPIGARVLRVALDYDHLEGTGLAADRIVATLRARPGGYDPSVLAVLDRLPALSGQDSPRSMTLAELAPGLVVAEDIKASNGTLLIARGHELTEGSLLRLRNFAFSVGVREPLQVSVPELVAKRGRS
jgi:response regulator RpfG family c-di-GMP phosphodiesterase